jgi:diguanylate cyclase (GGDEF)-like protein
MDQIKQRSRGIFYVIAVLLLILVIQVALYGSFFKSLRDDSAEINDLSKIRGEIQRYTKLEIANFDAMQVQTASLEGEIDALISKNMEDFNETNMKDLSRFYELTQLDIKWRELKSRVSIYQSAPTKDTLFAVIGKSEECWGIADANVIRQQYIIGKTTSYSKYFTVTFGINLLIIILILVLYKQLIHNSLRQSAVNDALTSIFNKGYFDEYLTYEIARALRKQQTLSLIMFDIDHFKHVNDTYGHRRGDTTLKTLTEVVQKCKRNADVLARVGGEEFILLLPDTGSEDAFLLATRIRKAVEDYPFEEIGSLTISLGITDFVVSDDKDKILTRVDAALYKAKENGRNRCELVEG